MKKKIAAIGIYKIAVIQMLFLASRSSRAVMYRCT